MDGLDQHLLPDCPHAQQGRSFHRQLPHWGCRLRFQQEVLFRIKTIFPLNCSPQKADKQVPETGDSKTIPGHPRPLDPQKQFHLRTRPKNLLQLTPYLCSKIVLSIGDVLSNSSKYFSQCSSRYTNQKSKIETARVYFQMEEGLPSLTC